MKTKYNKIDLIRLENQQKICLILILSSSRSLLHFLPFTRRYARQVQPAAVPKEDEAAARSCNQNSTFILFTN